MHLLRCRRPLYRRRPARRRGRDGGRGARGRGRGATGRGRARGRRGRGRGRASLAAGAGLGRGSLSADYPPLSLCQLARVPRLIMRWRPLIIPPRRKRGRVLRGRASAGQGGIISGSAAAGQRRGGRVRLVSEVSKLVSWKVKLRMGREHSATGDPVRIRGTVRIRIGVRVGVRVRVRVRVSVRLLRLIPCDRGSRRAMLALRLGNTTWCCHPLAGAARDWAGGSAHGRTRRLRWHAWPQARLGVRVLRQALRRWRPAAVCPALSRASTAIRAGGMRAG